MADIISFKEFMFKKRDRRSSEALSLGPDHSLDRSVRIRDFPDEILLDLAEGGVKGNALLDNLVLGIWGMDPVDICEVVPPIRMRLLDLSLLLIDQLRFECMVRLGWIDPLPVRDIPLVKLVLSGEETRRQLRKTPELKDDHPKYHCFQGMMDIERETYIRGQIPSALEQFRLRLKRG